MIAESDGDDETPLEVKETSKSPDITDRSAAFKKWAAGSTSFTPTEKSKGKPAMRSDKQQKQQKRQDNFKEKNQDRYSWLLKVRDIDGHMPDSPAYDPRTLHVPREAFNIFSPFEKQYWQIKKHLWDTVLFFQKGKFYELYENDATIGHQQFDLKMTDRVNMRMVGVPEASIDYWAAQFIAKGYKVAKASQSENQISKDMRQKAFSGKKTDADKVIRRHLECVLTSGTLVDESMLTHETATYCMAIKETVSVDTLLPKFGICFVDTSTGSFKLSFFNDDQDRTGLETLLTQTAPRELVLEKGCISQSTMKLIKSSVSPSTLWNQILPSKEFWDKSTTVSEILKANYFDSEEDKWPAAIRQIIEDSEEAVSATGALIWYLKYLKIDQDILSMKNFERYDPLHQDSTLILDGQTLKNLEIFRNSFDGGSQGTLLRLLDRCITPFGKRLFRSWLCHPLQSITLLSMRLDAVSYLMGENGSFFSDIFDAFSRLPDLERLLSRVHASKCPVKSFVRVIEGFDTVCKGLNQLKSFVENKNSCPQLILQYIKDAPDLNDLVAHWKNAFDMNEAVENGLLIPEIGFDSQFDQSQECVRSIEQDLDALRRNHAKSIKFSNVVFRDLGKEIYQLEVPVSVKVPSNWRQLSATSKVRRYYSPEVERKVRELLEAQETHKDAIRSLEERLYKKFDESYSLWMSALTCISKLDCLQSLATSSRAIGEPSCRPTFVDSTRAVTDFKELRHPYIGGDVTKDIIANDITLGGQHPKLVLLTGANMAGKSTLLRQTCVAVIMAQIGCYVPAQSATLTPFDRIMSRLGANDNIFASQSTFMVELNETKKIITEATPKSLVILDELGRGTSTHDGLAVAYSVLHHLASHCGCVGYFATHYGNLCEEFKSHPGNKILAMYKTHLTPFRNRREKNGCVDRTW